MPKSFETLLSSANKLIYDREDGLFVQFPVKTPATTYTKGQIVALLNDGTVEIATAADFPFGYVSVANIPNDPSGPIHHADYATIGTFCKDGAYGFAKGGNLAIGALVSADGQNPGDPTFMDYVAAATGTYATGIVVVGAAAGNKITVLLFNAPVLVP